MDDLPVLGPLHAPIDFIQDPDIGGVATNQQGNRYSMPDVPRTSRAPVTEDRMVEH